MTDVAVPTETTGSSDSAREALLQVRREVAKAVVGQDAAVSGILIALLSRGHILLEGVPGVAKTLLVALAGGGPRRRDQAGAVHPRPDARRHHRLTGLRHRTRPSSPSARDRSSPTSSSPTRSTGPRPRPRRPCSRPWRSGRSRSTGRRARCRAPSWSPPPRTPSSTRGPTPCPRPSSTGSCSRSSCPCRRATTRCSCCSGTRPASTRATCARRACGRWPARPTSTRERRRCAP